MGQKAVLAAGRHKSNDFYFFRGDYDFDELASNEGSDSDGDGLPDSFEGNEACFYKKMGWGAGDAVAADVIKADLVGLESGMKSEFDGNIDKGAGWNGSFGSRRKREAGETDTEVADVPSVMESGSSALSWLRSAVRKTRSAEPDKGKNNGENGKGKGKKDKGKNAKKGGNRNTKKKKNGKGGKKRKGGNRNTKKKKNGKGGKNRKGGKRTTTKNKKNSKGGKKGGNSNTKKKKNGKGGKNRKGGNRNIKKKKNSKGGKNGEAKGKGGKGKPNSGNGDTNRKNSKKSMDESTYNKLWCFDLSLEQVLEKCVEDKIKN